MRRERGSKGPLFSLLVITLVNKFGRDFILHSIVSRRSVDAGYSFSEGLVFRSIGSTSK